MSRLLGFTVLVTLAMSGTAAVSLWAGWTAATVQSARCQHLAKQLGMYYSVVKLDEDDGCLVWAPLEQACATAADTEGPFQSEEGW